MSTVKLADKTVYVSEDESIPFSLTEDAWASYKAFRPEYPRSMLDLWYDYHRRHGGKFDAAHDIGAGGGVLSELLAHDFAHVHVSDPGASNVAFARAALRPPHRFTVRRAPGEVPLPCPPGPVDLVAAGEALHWMDVPRALDAAAASLRPGGTFAAVLYSAFLVFPGPDHDHDDACPAAPRLNQLFAQFQAEVFRRFFVHDPRLSTETFRAALRCLSRGFNTIPLSGDDDGDASGAAAFCDWTRVSLNFHGRTDAEAFFAPFPPDLFPVAESRVRPDREAVIDAGRDRTWGRTVDVDWLKGYLVSFTMPYDQRTWDLPSWRELERVINEDCGGSVKVEWPVSMILGSRK